MAVSLTIQEEPRWTCFHCGETFTSRQYAADHFGTSEAEEPACQIAGREGGILNAFRKAREELARFYAEDTELHRYIHALQADHGAALQRAEEDGYNKGVREAQQEPAIRDAVAYAKREGWLAGREAAAQWHDEQAQKQLKRYGPYNDLYGDHTRNAGAIRALSVKEETASG